MTVKKSDGFRTLAMPEHRSLAACITLSGVLIFLLALTACNGNVSSEVAGIKGELNVTTEIENVILNFGGTVNINNELHQLSADNTKFCPNAPTPQLKVFDYAIQVDPDKDSSRLRKRPGTYAGELAAIYPGHRVYVFFGPVCVEGYNWYAVSTEDYVLGWVAEADKHKKTRWFMRDIRESQ